MKENETNRSTVPGKIKILFLAANPAFTQPLKIDEEIRAIKQKIRSAEYRDSMELVSAWAVRPDDLMQILLEHKPHIVHFSGHGESTGELILLDKDGNPKPVKPEAIQSLFTILKDNIRIVFFNACYTEKQARAINEVIDCVIGMNTYISDQAATVFAASFYRALAFGRSVKEAFELGKAALKLEGIPEERIPKLLTKAGIDSSNILLAELSKSFMSDNKNQYKIRGQSKRKEEKKMPEKDGNFMNVKIGHVEQNATIAQKIDVNTEGQSNEPSSINSKMDVDINSIGGNAELVGHKRIKTKNQEEVSSND